MHDLVAICEVQVAAAARERAEIAEQRLAQRAELFQERQQHADNLSQASGMLHALHGSRWSIGGHSVTCHNRTIAS